ncbi:DUF4130 domain-containing protein [Caenimonas sedimenti]|uniref:DUF4130 domain-containing protein n=1 Tax=Caenimonas sedimenti TaxID=2596921 RepID=A0A562ZX57_9BURK|nr:DUF4130 domain-containing protein [Caenimonas sedimenti]TWO72875.1 DUF4130 domain-containing protein [Caenimonas sedimenti]
MPRLISTNFDSFATQAGVLLTGGVHPASVSWDVDPGSAVPPNEVPPVLAPKGGVQRRAGRSAVVPASFVKASEYVVRHRDDDRFDVLYRLLWRFVHEAAHRPTRDDPDMHRVLLMAHAVRRNIHKLKMQTRLRAIPEASLPGGALLVGWCEPAHRVLEPLAQWLAKQHAGACWMLLSPQGSAYWDTALLHYAAGLDAAPARDAADEDWTRRWHALFPLAAAK